MIYENDETKKRADALVNDVISLVVYRQHLALKRRSTGLLLCPESGEPCMSDCIFFHLSKGIKSNYRISISCRAVTTIFITEL